MPPLLMAYHGLTPRDFWALTQAEYDALVAYANEVAQANGR